MEAEPVTVTVSGGLGVREMRRVMPCSHVTSACVFVFDAGDGLNDKNIHMVFTFNIYICTKCKKSVHNPFSASVCITIDALLTSIHT